MPALRPALTSTSCEGSPRTAYGLPAAVTPTPLRGSPRSAPVSHSLAACPSSTTALIPPGATSGLTPLDHCRSGRMPRTHAATTRSKAC